MVELRNEWNQKYGIVGKKANFQDSNGDNLYVGDTVKIEGVAGLSIICQDTDERFNVMGIFGEDFFGEGARYKIYKEKSYKSMNIGDKIRNLRFVDVEIKEMTIAEIEEELGHPVKIIKEED